MAYNSAYSSIKGSHIDNDNIEVAKKYATSSNLGTGYLGYRDLATIIANHACRGTKALDYGCGAGYSSWLLKSFGFDVVGVDISEHMLSEAKKTYQNIEFYKSELGVLPFEKNRFDLVLSTFVLFDIPSIEEVTRYLCEAKRVLTSHGIFIAVTGSEHFHINNWLTALNDVEKNKSLSSGETYSVKLVDDDITFHDFFYTEADYLHAFDKAGFKKIVAHYPLGKPSDNIPWLTEWESPPYAIYVCHPHE